MQLALPVLPLSACFALSSWDGGKLLMESFRFSLEKNRKEPLCMHIWSPWCWGGCQWVLLPSASPAWHFPAQLHNPGADIFFQRFQVTTVMRKFWQPTWQLSAESLRS